MTIDRRSTRRRVAAGACLAGLATWSVAAEVYPDHAVKVIVPYAVGGANDQVARIVFGRLQSELKQTFVIENRPGSGGMLGVASVARASPDGYTLVAAETGSIAISPSLHKDAPYDSLRDLVPVAAMVEIPLIIVANPATGLHDLPGLAAYGAGKVTPYGSAGIGTVQHLTMELLKGTMKLRMTHVPYKGGAPAMTDLIAGQIPILPVSASTAQPQVAAGKANAIAALGIRRSSTFPSLPTATEQGYPSLNVTVWQGLFAPAGTPATIVDHLGDEVRRVLAEPDIRKAVTALAVEPLDIPRDAFARMVADDARRWAQVIRDEHLSAE